MKRSVVIISLLALFSSLYAQHSVRGKVVDESSGEQVEMAAVRLFSYTNGDSTMVEGVQTGMDGSFLFERVRKGKYRIIVSSVGYRQRSVEVEMSNNDVNIGRITIEEEVQVLEELQVKGHAAEMTVKGDTLEYNTSAYKVGENDMVEDLLKKMSGVEVDTEGNVKVNGESITGIKIDGKTFFGDDVQTATKNIPADMIEKIQVIDEKSDMAKLTGFEDDDTERIINLQLKEDKKRGIFGNFNGGLGADLVANNGKWLDYNNRFMAEDFRYNASAFLNILSGETQTTIIGGGNNTNELRSGRGRGPFGGQNSGITWTENLGVNTNIAGKNGWLFGGDAQMTHSYNDTKTKSENRNWTNEHNYQNNDTTSKLSNTWDAKTQLEFEWDIDSLNTLIIKPEISYTHSLSSTYDAYDYFRDNDTATIGLQNTSDRTSEIGAKLKTTYSHKFFKPGRTFTLNASVNFSNQQTDAQNNSLNYYYSNDSVSVTDLWTDKTRNSLSYELKASYVEPIYGKNHFLETAVSFSQNNRWSEKQQWKDSLKTDFDSEYSNSLKTIFLSEVAEVNYKWVEKNFDLTAGLKVNPSQTLSNTRYGDGRVLERTNIVWNFSPNASFKYKFGKKEFARIQYRGKSSQPSIDQMEPVKDNTNAMSESVGNLSLLPAFQHTLRFMYSKFNQDRFSSIMTGLRATLTKDALVSNNIYDESGKIYHQTVNAQTIPFSVDADLMYNTPFGNKLFQFNTRTTVGYNRHIAYVAHEMASADIEQMITEDRWMLGDESRTGNLQLQEDLSLRFTHEVVDIGARGNFTYSFTHNNLTADSKTQVFKWSVIGDITFHLPRSWQIGTDIGYTDRIGYGKDLGDLSEIMWNASVSKSWSVASLTLQANDILNQKKNVVQTVGESSIKYQRYNTLPTYIMLSFTYKLNRMGDLKAKGKAGKMQEMIEGNFNPMKGDMPQGPPHDM